VFELKFVIYIRRAAFGENFMLTLGGGGRGAA